MLLLITLTVSLAVGFVGDEPEWTDCYMMAPNVWVAPHHQYATDLDNPRGLHDAPRVTVPELVAGDRVALWASNPPYTGEIVASGTADEPIIIRGYGEPGLRDLHIVGGHVVIERCIPVRVTADGPILFKHCPRTWLQARPGDANGDGRVDLDDFASVKAHMGETEYPGQFIMGDLDGDSDVDLDDFAILKANFGQVSPRE